MTKQEYIDKIVKEFEEFETCLEISPDTRGIYTDIQSFLTQSISTAYDEGREETLKNMRELLDTLDTQLFNELEEIKNNL